MTAETRRRLSQAILLALVVEIPLLLLAWKATPAVSGLAHSLAFVGIDFSTATPEQVTRREKLQDVIYSVLSALYLVAGFIFILPLFRWASPGPRLAVCFGLALQAAGIGLWRDASG